MLIDAGQTAHAHYGKISVGGVELRFVSLFGGFVEEERAARQPGARLVDSLHDSSASC